MKRHKDQDRLLQTYIDTLLMEPETDHQAAPEIASVTARQDDDSIRQQAMQTASLSNVLPWLSTTDSKRSKTFDCLMFGAAGLSLAIPLSRLNGILRREEAANLSMPAGDFPSWFLGQAVCRGKQVDMIDLAGFMLSRQPVPQAVSRSENLFTHLLLIAGGSLALACNDLGKVLKLSEKDVCWSDGYHSQSWVAGIVSEQVCTLVDARRIAEIIRAEISTARMINEGDRTARI